MKTSSDPPSSEITPESVYFNRRSFMKAGVLAASAVATGWVYRRLNSPSTQAIDTPEIEVVRTTPPPPRLPHGRNHRLPSRISRTTTTSTSSRPIRTTSPRRRRDFKTAGWKVEVGGLVSKPRVFDLDDLLKIAPAEERVYRMRCVEAWSMVIPWAGFSLSRLLAASNRWAAQVRRLADAARSAANARAEDGACWSGPTSRACVWMKRCTR